MEIETSFRLDTVEGAVGTIVVVSEVTFNGNRTTVCDSEVSISVVFCS